MLKKSVFTIGDYPKAYIGFTEGKLWNGWATPFFEKAEADKVAEGFNECAEFPMQYDEIYDQFYILDKETEELEKWEGIDYPTTEGIKHLYGIGAYSWVWDKANDEDIYFLAEAIEEFIYEYDTYEARDLYEFREKMFETIKTQLKELTIFQKVYDIWHNDDLTEEFKYEALGEVLSV